MQIESKEKLVERIEQAIAAIASDETYTKSLAALIEAKENLEGQDWAVVKEQLAWELHDADNTYPMHSEVAKLLLDIYEDGIESNNADAMCALGALYYTGRAGEQNYEKAAHYYEMADKAGNRQATENLGYIYYYGRIGQKDYEKAFKCFIKCALEGQIRSLYKVGDFYKNGYYVEKDPLEAFHIYQQCVHLIDDDDVSLVGAEVYMRMGDCFYEGCGVEKNLLLAQQFLSSAENLFYQRLTNGDFYQKRNLQHVLSTLDNIRQEIKESLPDLSWSNYNS